MRSRLLIRHFLRRFLDNDLLSPEADRHQVLAVSCAALISLGTFTCVIVSTQYLFRPLQAPGWTAVTSLDDLFLFCGASMLLMALIAVMSWHGLALDARDSTILGPLPVPTRTLFTARLAATALFATGFALALNLVPSVLAPVLRVSKLPIGLFAILGLVAAQVMVATAAGVFGFGVIFALHQVLAGVFGARISRRLAAPVQSGLVLLLATGLMLLPGLANRVEPRLGQPGSAGWMPPLWFVGLHDVVAGDLVDRLPRTDPPSDAPGRLRLLDIERTATSRYRQDRPVLARLAGTARAALGLTLLVAAVAYLWNSRRLPAPDSEQPRRSRTGLIGSVLARTLAPRDQVTRAGFFFALHVLARSIPHRIALATSAGIAIALTTVILGRTASVDATFELLTIQPMFLAAVLAGFWHATRVPAAARAHAPLLLSWPVRDRRFRHGAMRAGLVAVALPCLLVLSPLHVAALGWLVAVAHAAFGGLVAAAILEMLFFRTSRAPFVSSYVPTRNELGLLPIHAAAVLIASVVLATVEQAAFASPAGTLTLLGAAALVWLAVRKLARSEAEAMFDQAEDGFTSATQRFSLSD